MTRLAVGPLSDATRRRRADAPLAPPLHGLPERALADVAFPPVVAGERALVALRAGELVALDVATGARRWSVRFPGAVEAVEPHAGAPIVDSERVWLRQGAELWSIELATGTVSTRQPVPALDLLSGVLGAGCIVSHVADAEGRLVAWDLGAGVVRWSRPHAFTPVPIAASADLLIAAEGGLLRGHDPRDGIVRWETETGDAAIGAVAVAPDGGVLVARSRDVVCLDPASGEPRWRAAAPVARPATMAVTDDGEIHLLDLQRYVRLSAADGRVVFERELPRAALPALRGSLGRLEASRSHVFGCDQRGPVIAVARFTGNVEWTHSEPRPRAARHAPVATAHGLFTLGHDGALEWFAAGG